MGTQEWLIIGAIVLVLFGSTKIPQLARGLGEGIREFKKSVTPGDDDAKPTDKTEDKKDV
jgi:sec-independent protein translocase protein TatA